MFISQRFDTKIEGGKSMLTEIIFHFASQLVSLPVISVAKVVVGSFRLGGV